MLMHKYKIGAVLDFQPGRSGFPAANRQCTIVRLLPADGSDCLYRIKCESEAFERVVRETQLADPV